MSAIITETYVKHSTAIAIKANGFDWACRFQYNDSGELEEHNLHNCFRITRRNNRALAPSLSMVQKWLRDIHQLNIRVSFDKSKWYYDVHKMDTGFRLNGANKSEPYPSYEMAQEAAIDACMALLYALKRK